MGRVLISVLVNAFFYFGHSRLIPDYADYIWRTGGWESCSALQEGGCGTGTRARGVWCYEQSSGEAVSPEFCKSKEKPVVQKRCFIACRHHKDDLEWKVGEWGPCLVAENQILEYGTGLMQRNVSCVLNTHASFDVDLDIDDENCYKVGPRPEPIQQCSLPIRQDCTTTDWTEWTPCCDGSQFRTRTILVPPKNGGTPCPETNEWRSCGTEDDSCFKHQHGFRLRIGPWGECIPKVEAIEGGSLSAYDTGIAYTHTTDSYYKHRPNVGTQTRDIDCLNVTSEVVPLKFCDSRPLPPKTRACIIPQDCVVSEWSEWVIRQDGCNDYTGKVIPEEATRERYILRMHEGQGLKCPHLTETRSRKDRLPLCINKYKWEVSKWSVCSDPITSYPVQCGGGIQTRNATCVDAKSGQPLPNKNCRSVEKPPSIQRCEMACPRDCEVSQWGSWGACLPSQCPFKNDGTEATQTGVRKRFRNVVVPPSELGMECPNLSESQPCTGTECYTWSAGSWGSCQLETGLTKCGSGRRTRQVFCVTHHKEIVDESKCHADSKPSIDEFCVVPCANDCVVSSWSEWTPCSRPCRDSGTAGIRSRNRTIIAPPGPGGHPCPSEDDMTQVDRCNDFGCNGYSWMALPWQDCNATCGSGLQNREVWCIINNDERVDDRFCEDLPKPNEYRSCMSECENECRVSKWSAWSKCPKKTCFPINSKKEEQFYRRRTRVSLDGQYCTHLEEKEPCPTMDDDCPIYNWTIGEWSECQMAESSHCGYGLRVREIGCVDTKTSRPAELRDCFKTEVQIPLSVQRCHVDCHTPCQVTEWGNWPLCKGKCFGYRHRSRELIGESYLHKTCSFIKLTESEQCPCNEYRLEPYGKWGACIINGTFICGTGVRYRARICYNAYGQKIDPSLCEDSGIEEEPCMIPCPVDCKVSEWTKWSECSVSCGPGMHQRTRQILVPPSNGGRACPSVLQEKPCNVPCNNFQWQTNGWSNCDLDNTASEFGCGNGKKYRNVWCLNLKTGQEVDQKYCDWIDKPSNMSSCSIACPGDCVLSEWSDWSSCSKDCVKGEQQQRTRSLLRNKSPEGRKCPHSIETQDCVLNVTCFTYKWAYTPFSSCLPLGGSPCGEGITTKAVYCQRSDFRAVDDSFCSDTIKPSPEEKWCYIDCPVDCEVEGWTSWNISECKCNDTGGMSRGRIIKTPASQTGRQCPKDNIQWKPCPPVPCYQWTSGSWSHCQLHGGSCGHGVTNRNITCVRKDDLEPVDNIFCSSLGEHPSTWEHCFIPCNNDCQLSQWSEWSACHGDCKKDKIGYQTRSRTVLRPPPLSVGKACPEPLWETRDCDIGPCIEYEWKVTDSGSIICVRSDGVIVDAGCDHTSKPSSKCILFEGRCLCTENIVFKAIDGNCPEQFEVEALILSQHGDDEMFMQLSKQQICIMFFTTVVVLGILIQTGW
ncbi:hypothetical protein V9T40_011968 [Parthenolecanium corni]|uniref:Spondin-like TSP1 domain-containing protein n=1 Tax=Parthenolecanium corni TaxID=536013 RepID=A0AAN9TJN1_9HEMI